MSARRHTIIASLLAALLHQAAWSQEDPARLLIDQGRYWEERGDRERAGQAWQKLLNIDPANPQGLYGLARIEIAEKRPAGAQKYLDRLRAIDPRGHATRQLEQDLRVTQAGNAKELESARLLAQSGELAESIPLYQKALDEREPVGDLGLEYYGRLGYTEGGWDAARRGLERLLRENPGDPAIQLTLAKLLILNQGTWRDGIERLAELAKRADVGGEATESWRLGLIWRGFPSPSERPLYTAYLQAHPDDTEVRDVGNQATHMQRQAKTGHTDPLLKQGFAALDKKDLPAAERAFQSRLERSANDADALGGLGLVRMQQERLPEAHDLLTRAAQRNARAWTPSLNVARYWILLAEADKAIASAQLDKAQDLAERARTLLPREAAAHNTLAALRAERGDTAGAEAAYREVLSRHGNDSQALEGLVVILASQGRIAEARQAMDQLATARPGAGTDLPRARAALASGQARVAREAGDLQGARAALEQALRDDPRNPWIRYELGRLHLEAGARAQARQVRDELVAAGPQAPNAVYAGALLAGEMGDWDAAEAALASIAPASRTAAMLTFGGDVRVQREAQAAAALAKAGRGAQALGQLALLEADLAGRPVRIGAVATAYVDAGDAQRALTLMREALAATAEPGPALLLQHAGVLLKAEQDEEFASTMQALHARRLTPSEQGSYNDLQHLYVLRQADRLRESGDLEAAYDMLAPALANRPDDPLAVMALARMYSDSGDASQALALYKPLLSEHGENPEILMGAALAAAQAGDGRYADRTLEQAIALRPDDADTLVAAARIYRLRGKDGRAAELLQQALAARERNATERSALATRQPGAAQAAIAGNPFAGLPRRQRAAAPAVAPNALASGSARPSAARTEAVPRYIPNAAPALAAAPAASARIQPYGATQAALPRTTQAVVPRTASAVAFAAPPSEAGARDTVPAVPAYGQQPARTAGLAAKPADPGAEKIRAELDEIMQDRSAEARAGLMARSNNGERGTSRLTTIEAPVAFSFPAGDGRATLNATAVQLRSGNVGGDFQSSSRFGGGPAAALQQAAGAAPAPRKQQDEGIGLSAAYEMRGLRADLGTTPLGFERTNLVGGLRLDGNFGGNSPYWYGVDLSRRAVTDSVLSFAGTQDRRTGQRWGGVTSTGVQFQLGADYVDYGFYGSASWHALDGHNVESNQRGEVAGGLYRHLIREQDTLLTAGLHASATFYDNNQRFFTYGHGGYFSPQDMVYLGLPLTWAQRGQSWTYRLQGSIGVQHFKEDDTDYFPGSGALQAQADAAMADAAAQGLGFGGRARYEGQRDTGVGYSLLAAAEYQMAPQWFVGANAGLDNAKDYRQWSGGLYLRYALYPMTRSQALPLSPYPSPYRD